MGARTRASSRSPTQTSRSVACSRTASRFRSLARRSTAALEAICAALRAAGRERTREEVAAGFVEVANASMAQAIAQVSVARGVDPRECALVGFGGAGGQHVCAVARSLGMRDVILHPLAGNPVGVGDRDLGRELGRAARRTARAPCRTPARRCRRRARGIRGARARGARGAARGGHRRIGDPRRAGLDLRHVGTETALAVAEPANADWAAAFARDHEKRFGYTRPGHAIEIAAARVRVFEESPRRLRSPRRRARAPR
jgi:5-oxoprolinase (ATP-hydrolysing)